MADPTPITLDQLARFAVDQSHHLYWDGQEVVTTLALPWIVQIATIIGAGAALVAALWPVFRYFLDRHFERRRVVTEET